MNALIRNIKKQIKRRFTMTFDKIKQIIADQLALDNASVISLDTSLMKDLEADSLDAVEIIMAIEDEFDIEIPDEDAEKFQTIGDIVKYVEEKIN
jgi:acyl carrier protein